MGTKSEPLLIWSSILVVLQILAGGAALGDVIGPDAAGIFILAVAALQGGTQFYVRGQVTPTANVAATVDKTGDVVAGPASSQHVGTPVAVTPAGRPSP